MSEDKLRRSLEELFSEFSPPEPEGEAERPVPPPSPAGETGHEPASPPPPPAEAVAAPPTEVAAPLAAVPRLITPEEEPEEVEKAPEALREGGVVEGEMLPLIAARVTSVRDRLIGSLLIVLSLLVIAILLVFTSLTQMEEAATAVQQELVQENAALEVERTAIELLALLEEEGASRDTARFRQVVGGALQALEEAQDRLSDVILTLPPGDPLRSELVRLGDYSLSAANLASSVLRYAEEGNWERVEFYTAKARFISHYYDRLTGVIARVKALTAERQAAQLAVAAQARQRVRTIPVVWGLLIAATALLTTVATVRGIARPLERLTRATSRLAAGHLDERVHIEQEDEFGRLSIAFNQMAESLQALYNELEERVRERTRALQEANYALQRRAMQLETSAEISRAITSIFDVDQLLRRTVDLIRERFGFYHAGIFLMDETGQWAVLREATGEAGATMKARGHRLPVGETSMVGWTALHRQPRIALDVGEDAVHFANPLLPYTRSEMTLPLMVGDRLLGVLDVQSTEEAAFDEDDVRALQSMADQIAIAIENARRVSEEAALLEATSPIYRASRRLTTAISVEEVVDVIVASVRETGVDGCIVALAEPYGSAEPEAFHFVSSWRRDQESPIRPGTRLPASSAHMRAEMMRTLWAVEDLPSSDVLEEGEKRFFLRAGVKAIVNIPLRVGDRLLGFVVAYRVTAGAFPEGALRLYEVLSDQASVALERVRLLEITRQRAEMETAVRTIGDRIARAVDLENVVQEAAEGLRQLLRASGVYVELGTGLTTSGGWEREDRVWGTTSRGEED